MARKVKTGGAGEVQILYVDQGGMKDTPGRKNSAHKRRKHSVNLSDNNKPLSFREQDQLKAISDLTFVLIIVMLKTTEKKKREKLGKFSLF